MQPVRLSGGMIMSDSKDAPAYNNRGNARRAKGDLDGAIADFTEALRLDPSLASVWNDPQAAPPPPVPAAVAAAPAEDVFEKLKKLDELRKAGIVTDAEFEEKKKDLLGRL